MGRAARRYTLILGGLYAVAAGLLFASRIREFADETDNLLGGLLLSRGARLYVDYFSNHMPLAYYVAAVPALLGASSLEQFRIFSDTLLIIATLGIVWAFRTSLPLLTLGLWAVLTVFTHNLQWGEMLTAGTLAGYGILAAGLLFFTTPDLRFSTRQMSRGVLHGSPFGWKTSLMSSSCTGINDSTVVALLKELKFPGNSLAAPHFLDGRLE